MQERELGRSGIRVSAVGLGLMSMSGVYGNANDDESIARDPPRLDKGITFLDSADMYGWGHNETLLGKALKGGWRGKAIVATKFGQVKQADGKQGVDGRPGVRDAGLRGEPEAPRHRRHRPLLPAPRRPEHADRGHRRRDEATDRAGQGTRARAVGSAIRETIRRAHKVHPIAAVQNEYSLLYRNEGEETLSDLPRARASRSCPTRRSAAAC